MERELPDAMEPASDGALEALIGDVLAEAQRGGASAAEVALGEGAGLSVTARMGEVETIEHQRSKGLALTVYVGKRKGSASTSDLSPRAITETVDAALSIAARGGEDDYAGLADAELMTTEVPDLDLCHPWRLEPESAVSIALEAEDAARSFDRRITNSEGASVGSHAALRAYGNSHGFVGSYRTTRHSLSSAVIAESDGTKQRDYWYSSARASDALEAPESVGRRSAERAVRRLGARRVPTCKVPVVYAAEVAGSLLGHLVAAASGGTLYRKASFLLDALGERVFPERVRIHEQPRLPRGIGSAPFDGEGVATQDRDLVSAGILRSYVLAAYSARRLGLRSTGNSGGVRNLTIEPTGLDRAEILRTMGRGLLVTELIGMGVNTVTGDYSRGAAGFWVENGEIAHPVEEITVAGNLREMFLGIQAVGTDLDLRGNVRTGSILVERMTVAGS